jgi:hypothetical protein
MVAIDKILQDILRRYGADSYSYSVEPVHITIYANVGLFYHRARVERQIREALPSCKLTIKKRETERADVENELASWFGLRFPYKIKE